MLIKRKQKEGKMDQSERMKDEIVAEISGKPIEDIFLQLKSQAFELEKASKKMQIYQRDLKAIREIAQRMLSAELKRCPELAEPIAVKYEVHPDDPKYQECIGEVKVVLEAVQWMRQCCPKEADLLEEEVQEHRSKKHEREQEMTALRTELEKMQRQSAEIAQKYKETYIQKMKEKDEVIQEQEKMVKKLKEEARNAVGVPITPVIQPAKIIASKSLLSALSYEEILEIAEQRKESANPRVENGVIRISAEKMMTQSAVKERETIDKNPRKEGVQAEDGAGGVTLGMGDPDIPDFPNEEIWLSADVDLEGGRESAGEGVEEEEDVEELDGLEYPEDTDPIAIDEAPNVEATSVETSIQELFYVQLLEKHGYEVEASPLEEFDVFVKKGEEEKVPLRFVYYEMEKDDFNGIMENTNKIYFVFDSNKHASKGNTSFTSWILKQKARRHEIEYSFTTIDQLKVSGLDELDTL